MKKLLFIFPLLLLGIILSSDQKRTLNIVHETTLQTDIPTQVADSTSIVKATPIPASEDGKKSSVEITQTPEPFPDLYDCKINLSFTSGPLNGNQTDFTVLGRDYFENKGDQFFPGKNTAVYYDPPRYLILHSAFLNGNMLKPLEAEFIRYYLEYWGESGNAFVQGNIDSLIGSSVTWECNGQLIFTSKIREIVRLSQTASDQLWLAPRSLEQILINKEGLVSEWIGEMNISSEPTIYLGFCGWGPENSGEHRFVYYRYLMNFDLDFAP